MNPRRRRSFELPQENLLEATGVSAGWTHENDQVNCFLKLDGWDGATRSNNALQMSAESVAMARQFINDFLDYIEPICAERDAQAERELTENEGNDDFRPDRRLYQRVPTIHRGLRTAARNGERLRK